MEFKVGDQVRIHRPQSKAHGLVGDVVRIRKTILIGDMYEVDFHQDISHLTAGVGYATVMCMDGCDLVKYDEKVICLQPHDFNTLIDMALESKDEHWFRELIERQQQSEINKVF